MLDPQKARADALVQLHAALDALKQGRPLDRSEEARYWAIAVTDLERVIAFVKVYIPEGKVNDASL